MTHNPSVETSIATGRRPFLKTVGLSLGGTALLTGSVATASARGDEFTRELNEVRAATRKYRDVATARADGYTEGSPYVPNMGFHFVNDAYVANNAAAAVDLSKPPILVYYTTGDYNPGPGDGHDSAHDDDLRLGAVEFAHGETGVAGDVFADETSARSLTVSEEMGWEPIPGAPLMAVHVWVHRGNPAGVFNPTNPTVD